MTLRQILAFIVLVLTAYASNTFGGSPSGSIAVNDLVNWLLGSLKSNPVVTNRHTVPWLWYELLYLRMDCSISTLCKTHKMFQAFVSDGVNTDFLNPAGLPTLLPLIRPPVSIHFEVTLKY
jgi:hypothetical protein